MTYMFTRTYSKSFNEPTPSTFHGQIFSRLKHVTLIIGYVWLVKISVIEILLNVFNYKILVEF